MNEVFVINGGKKLQGTVSISGSKNAALPILASTIAIKGKSVISNLPQISDVEHFLEILSGLGAEVKKINSSTVEISTDKIKFAKNLTYRGIEKMRAAILLLGPLLARFGEVKMPFPGGCVLGKRSAHAHLSAFQQMGASIIESKNYLHLKLNNNTKNKNKIILPEMSVTATENALIFASYFKKVFEIRLAATEPHVQNLCEFLKNAGAKISGIGTCNVEIQGGNLKNGKVKIIPDMLEAGTFILATAVTNGEVLIKNVVHNDLDIFYEKLREVGVNFSLEKNAVKINSSKLKLNPVDFKTAVFPGFPTDLMAPFAVLLTQTEGVSRIFETLFEGRFAFLIEIEKMGAKVEVLNPHQAIIIGKTPLKGARVASQDIRAGAAVVIAALAAKGKSEISNVQYIFRGYENMTQKLQKIGADIKLENSKITD